jgi:DNA-binding response OmpR family regulator/Tfp pilus assembly protein PilZ
VAQDERSLVVVGPFREETIRRIQDAAAEVNVRADMVGRCEETGEALAKVQPLAIILRMDAPGAAKACAIVRSHARLAQLPIFGVTSERNDLAFTELFVWGGDDLVGVASPHPIVRRLRALKAQPLKTPVERAAPRELAIVAGPEATWRSVMGRVLYNGGFAVRFAASAEGLVEEAVADNVRVVVAADNLPGGACEALASVRARGSKAAWVLVVPPKRMSSVHAIVAPLGRASLLDGFAPPENVLFTVNELLGARGVDKRASPRLLYGTTVAFRAAGRDEDEIGFSYNVSAGGVFVRTLAPLEPRQEVWLEMWPPRSERRVRLSGIVAWRRHFGPNGGATVPAGFGVQITDGLSGDLDRWRAGCDMFADSLLGMRTRAPSSPEV